MQHHLDYSDSAERGMYRVLYVNGVRWSAWPTPEGERLLPEGGYWERLPLLTPCWGELTFCENASRTSGMDITDVGLVTPGVVVCATLPDEWADTEILLKRRGDDAVTFVEWLLGGRLTAAYSGGNPDMDLVVAQLFVESAMNNLNGESIAGSYLVAGTEGEQLDEMMFVQDSSEWQLKLDLEPGTIDAVLDLLAQRSPQLCDIVMASRSRIASGPCPTRRSGAMGAES